MKRTAFVLIALIMAAVLAIAGCSDDAASKASALARATARMEGKRLSAESDSQAVSWKYKAEPRFTPGSGEPIYGEAGWTDLAVTDGAADLGLYTQGSWQFSLRGFNSAGQPVLEGSAAAYLRAGAANSVAVALDSVTDASLGTGTIRFGIETNRLEASQSAVTLQVSLSLSGGAPETRAIAWDTSLTAHPSWYGDTDAVAAGRIFYSGSIEGLAPGSAAAAVRLLSGDAVIGGQEVGCPVVAGGTSTVKGTLLPGEFISEGLTIVAPGVISGSLSGGVLECRKDSSITLTWTPAANSAAAVAYAWHVDGVQQASEAVSFAYTPVTYGDHTVSVIALGSDMAEIGSASVIVKVRPDEAKTFDSFSSLASLPGVMSRIPADKVLVGFTDSTVKAAGDRITFPYTAKASDLEPVYENLFPLADYADGMTGAAYVNERIVTSSLDAESGLHTTMETTQSPVVVGYIGAATAIALPESIGGIQGASPENYQSGFAGLSEIVLPDGLADIGCCAFAQCASLEKVRIPDTVTGIQGGAFAMCGRLSDFAIPDSVEFVGTYAFLETPCAEEGKLRLPSGINGLQPGSLATWNFSSLSDTGLPDSKIGMLISSGALMASGIQSADIPDGITGIGDYAFRGCAGLKSVTIPDSVASIGDNAFDGCISLKSITIPSSVASIGAGAFDCCGLTSIAIPDGVTCIGDFAFCDCADLTSITIPDSVTSIGDCAFWGCSGLKSITIPVASIGVSAFERCGLTSIAIPSGVTSIGDYAFRGCAGLKSVTIPSSVTSIGVSAFSGCSGLTGITIPSGVTSIGAYAFNGCSSLKSITIPSSVTSIGDFVFSGCTGLTSIAFGGTVAQWNAITKGTDWKANSALASVICSDGTVTL